MQFRCLGLASGSRSIDAELKQADTLMYHAKRDSIGLMMAILVKGDMQKLLPFAQHHLADQQRAAVRSAQRATQFATSDGTSENSIAA